jgi:hypothetical protein
MENKFPEKFQNEDGTLNAEALLKSYAELEKKIGGMVSVPSDDSDPDSREKFYRAIGVPENPADYPSAPVFADMPEIKDKFREIGLTTKQAESVCQMAEDMLMPAIAQIFAARGESECIKELNDFFGGDEKMRAALSEIDDFAEKNLPAGAYDALCSSAEGIKAIYGMMQPKDPRVRAGGAASENSTDADLRRMMRDPKYWRDRDEDFVRKVESGFKKLYK